MSCIDPAALVHGLKQGDEKATRAFVDLYYAPILGYLFRMLHGQQWTEDVCQETFVMAMQRIDQVTDPDALKAWLYRIATNMAHDHWRRVARDGPPLDSEELQYVEAAAAPVVGDRLYVADLLARLGDEHRTVIVLRYYEDMSLSTMSEVLDLPIGTVKSRLHYALRKLRQFVRAEEQEVEQRASKRCRKTSPSHVG